MIYVTTEFGPLAYDTSVFPGGEVFFRFKGGILRNDRYKIRADLHSSEDVMRLLMATDALRRAGVRHIDLVCPYFPAGRQDRVCNHGEALSLKVMANLINAQEYDSVEIWDAHSDVTPAVIDRCTNVHQLEFLKSANIRVGSYQIVAPDAGAAKKAEVVAKYFKCPLITASKKRNPLTTEIEGTSVDLPYIGKKWTYLIVDDICDAGRTFITLTNEIKRQDPDAVIDLYVTHGIFSAGFTHLKWRFRRIYTANIWPDKYEGNEDFVTVLNKG